MEPNERFGDDGLEQISETFELGDAADPEEIEQALAELEELEDEDE